MAEFDESWQKLVAAARRVDGPSAELSHERVAQLAAFARPRPFARSERRSLLALAALLACVLLALLPCRSELDEFAASIRAGLAQLPSRLPRPPRPPAASALLEHNPFSLESPP
jgi:hypothetical protein